LVGRYGKILPEAGVKTELAVIREVTQENEKLKTNTQEVWIF